MTHPCFTDPSVILPGCSWHRLPTLVLYDTQARSGDPAQVGHATAHLEWRLIHDDRTHFTGPAAVDTSLQASAVAAVDYAPKTYGAP